MYVWSSHIAEYGSTGQGCQSCLWSAVYFSVQDKVDLKTHATLQRFTFQYSSEVCVAHRIKTPHDYDSRPTLGGFRRPICLLGVCGLVNHLIHSSSSAGGCPHPPRARSHNPTATRSAKEVPTPPPAVLFSVGLRSSPAYLAF